MTTVQIPAEAVSGLVAKAIVDAVTPEQREQIITSAVTAAITPPPSSHGRQEPSPLQRAFDTAAAAAVSQVVRDLLADDPDFQARLRAAATDRMRDLMDTHFDLEREVVEAFATVVLSRQP